MSCHCFVKHPETPEERESIVQGMKYARNVGDSLGMALCLVRLSPCPSSNDTEKGEK